MIIAITKTDISIVEENAARRFEEGIQKFRTDYQITSEPVRTSAKTGLGIDQLYSSIEDIAYSKAKEAGEVIPDRIFLKAFKEHYLSHLRKPVEGNRKNQAKEVIDDAKTTIGKLSRLYDALDLPIASQKTFSEEIQKAGSCMAYMRPILNAAAGMLLNENRTRLSDEVIDAIGKENYAKIVGGVLVEGTIKAKSGNEKEFAQKEAEAARAVLASIAVNYSQSLAKYDLSPEEKECKKKMGELLDKNKQLEEKIKLHQELPLYVNQNIKIESLEELNNKREKLEQRINAMLLSKDASLDEMIKLRTEIKTLNDAQNNYFIPKIEKFTNEIIQPMQEMAKHFNLGMLDEPKEKGLSYKEVKQKVESFYGMALAARNALEPERAKLYRQQNGLLETASIPENQNLPVFPAYEAITTLVSQLLAAQDADDSFANASETTKKDFMLSRYNVAVQIFVEKVDNDALKAEPPHVRGVLVRLFDAISNWDSSLLFDTDEEVKEKIRFEQQTLLKHELELLKINEGKPEQLIVKKGLGHS
jgi:hypothetical protein